MKKVRFDTSGAIALQLKLGRELPSEQRKPIKLEGWLVGAHICVLKPHAVDRGWGLSLFPWGDRLTLDFFAKADAVACAKEIDALNLPWNRLRTLDANAEQYRDYIGKVMEIRADYEADGLIMPDHNI